MVCLDTPTSRATSSTARPASTCFKALIISASLCLPLDMVLPLSFDEIIFNFVRNQGSRSGYVAFRQRSRYEKSESRIRQIHKSYGQTPTRSSWRTESQTGRRETHE